VTISVWYFDLKLNSLTLRGHQRLNLHLEKIPPLFGWNDT